MVTEYIYRTEDEHIDRVHEIKDHGIILDVKLQFESHIEYITAKVK